MSSIPMMIDDITCIRMTSFELCGYRIFIYKLIDAPSPYAITNTRTGKSLLCISKEHADTIYEWCYDHLKMEFMGGEA